MHALELAHEGGSTVFPGKKDSRQANVNAGTAVSNWAVPPTLCLPAVHGRAGAAAYRWVRDRGGRGGTSRGALTLGGGLRERGAGGSWLLACCLGKRLRAPRKRGRGQGLLGR
jgi:hypothetical protein